MEKKSLVYIHPDFLDYYEDHILFTFFNSYESHIIINHMNKALKFLSYDNIIIKSYINLFFKNLYYILNLNNEFKKIK
ncbi:MAG: hypothetical protein ACP5IB_08750, partial [Thermoplasmata archaeon]